MLTYWKNNIPPTAPFFAVIFVSKKADDLDGYEEMDNLLMEESQKLEGFLGYSSASGANGGIFISYWQDESSIQKWRNHDDHKIAKQKAPTQWYQYYLSIISEVKSIKKFQKELSKI